MMMFLQFAFALMLAAAVASTARAEPTSRIVFDPGTSAGAVSVFLTIDRIRGRLPLQEIDGMFVAEVQHDFPHWFRDVVFTVVYTPPERLKRLYPAPIETEIPFRLVANDPLNIIIPAGGVITLNHTLLDELEPQPHARSSWPDARHAFRALIQASQAATVYRRQLGPVDANTRRAARLWFDAAHYLAKETNFRMLIPDAAKFAAVQAFGEGSFSQKRFVDHVSDTTSMYWERLDDVRPLLAMGDCAEARRLIEGVARLAKSRPMDAERRRVPRDHLQQHWSILDQTCEEATASQPPLASAS